MENTPTSPTNTKEFIGTLPFRSEQIDDAEANFDVSIWRCSENPCESQGDSPCDTASGISYGSAEDEVTKFCPRHFYEMHFGPGAAYRLVEAPKAWGDHPQGKRINAAMDLLHEVIDNWTEAEVKAYPAGLPSLEEFVADISHKLHSIEWR